MIGGNFDVAIVGAGTAGSAAALTVAPHASVALIDRVTTPGWRIGETLPGAARRVLAALGAYDRFAVAGHGAAPLKVSRWGSDQRVEIDSMRDPDGPGWRLDRARFESDLRVDAVDRGATLIEASVGVISREENGWRVRLDDGGAITAHRLIDASGRGSSLLRDHGQRRAVLDRLACVYQRVRQPNASDPITYTEACPDGWWYTALLPCGERIVAFHGDADGPAIRSVLREGPLQSALSLPGLAEAVGPVCQDQATDPSVCSANSVARSAAGDGWLAAGDGAIALDPLSSQGLLNALVTGLEAGEATLALLAGSSDASRRHAARMGRIWQAYLHHHQLFYGMERRWPDSAFWASRASRPAEVRR